MGLIRLLGLPRRLARVVISLSLVPAYQQFEAARDVVISRTMVFICARLAKVLCVVLLLCHYTACGWVSLGSSDAVEQDLAKYRQCSPGGPCEAGIDGEGSQWIDRYGYSLLGWSDTDLYYVGVQWAVAVFTTNSIEVYPGNGWERLFFVMVGRGS